MAALLRLGIIRIVTIIISSSKLRIRNDLVSLVNSRHFLLSILLGHTLGVRLVGMVLLDQLAICPLDSPVICVPANTKNLIVVLLL
jgi:hypothetical protein